MFFRINQSFTQIQSLNGIETESSKNEILLCVTLDNNLKLNAHIKSLCRKATHKLSGFSKI